METIKLTCKGQSESSLTIAQHVYVSQCYTIAKRSQLRVFWIKIRTLSLHLPIKIIEMMVGNQQSVGICVCWRDRTHLSCLYAYSCMHIYASHSQWYSNMYTYSEYTNNRTNSHTLLLALALNTKTWCHTQTSSWLSSLHLYKPWYVSGLDHLYFIRALSYAY